MANLHERHLTSAEKKKREEIAQAMERDNPGMDMSKKMAIATAQAKKVVEQVAESNDDVREQHVKHGGKHVATIRTFRGRAGGWLSSTHNPDGSSASKKYGIGMMDTKREMLSKIKKYHTNMNEAVEVSTTEYEHSHGKPRGSAGGWMFGRHKSVNFDKHKEGEDYVTINGVHTYGEAKKKAKAWAASKGHTLIHVLPESVQSVDESYNSDDAFDLLKKKGARNVRTTSGGIVYNHKGNEYILRHSDTKSGHRTVREAELAKHLEKLQEGRLGDILKDVAADELSRVANKGIDRLVYGRKGDRYNQGNRPDYNRPERESFPRGTLERPNSDQRPTYEPQKSLQRDYYREEYAPGKLTHRLLSRVAAANGGLNDK